MNYINCTNKVEPFEVRSFIVFWSLNTYQHINSLLDSDKGTTAILNESTKKELQKLYEEFKKINELYGNKENKNLPLRPNSFFELNNQLIFILEKLKFSGYNGYPELLQIIFHYLYEQKYINAVFSTNENLNEPPITLSFHNFKSYNNLCVYNQLYFFSILSAMHPSLILTTNSFYSVSTLYSKEFLTDITNRFNMINSRLDNLKKPYALCDIKEIYNDFQKINSLFLDFLNLAKTNSPKVYKNAFELRLKTSFYQKLEHIISEQKYFENLDNVLD